MPNLLIPIPHSYDAVSRRVAKSVISNLLRITRMEETTRVEIRGDSQTAAQPGSELTDDRLVNRLSNDGRVMVSFRETYSDSEVINAEVRHPYAQPIFADPMIGVHIKPVYSATDMELNFTYRAKSKQEAMIWRDDIKIRMADNRQSHLHEVDYHFPVPNFCAGLLIHIHELRESVAGYGDSLGQYLKKHYTKRATVLTNQAGSDVNTLLVIAEKQLGVQGWFDFDLPVEEEKNEDGPSYLIQFNYRFNYHKPVELNVVYPQVVHNQLISSDYLVVKPKEEDPLRLPSYKSDYRFALDHFDLLARIPPRALGGISIPDYDEWIPKSVLPYTTSLINWMVVFEPKDLHLILGEQDVLNTGLMPEVIAYMRDAGDALVRLGHAGLHFTLFRDLEPITDGDLEIIVTDKAFEVRCKTPADLRQRYHLRLDFCTELSKYREETLMSLHENGLLTLRLFQSVVNRLDVEDAVANHLDSEGRLSIPYIKRFFGFMRQQRYGNTSINGEQAEDGQGINNDRRDHESWYGNETNFGFRMDTPYVEYLTIIADNRN